MAPVLPAFGVDWRVARHMARTSKPYTFNKASAVLRVAKSNAFQLQNWLAMRSARANTQPMLSEELVSTLVATNPNLDLAFLAMPYGAVQPMRITTRERRLRNPKGW